VTKFCVPEGFSSNDGVKKGYPLKGVILPLLLYSVKTFADRYILVVYHNKHMVTGFLILSASVTLNDFESLKLEI